MAKTTRRGDDEDKLEEVVYDLNGPDGQYGHNGLNGPDGLNGLNGQTLNGWEPFLAFG